jgi:hypothetical protein
MINQVIEVTEVNRDLIFKPKKKKENLGFDPFASVESNPDMKIIDLRIKSLKDDIVFLEEKDTKRDGQIVMIREMMSKLEYTVTQNEKDTELTKELGGMETNIDVDTLIKQLRKNKDEIINMVPSREKYDSFVSK